VVREADRLGRIVDDLLDLSLIEAQEAPRREPVPVMLLVLEAVERVRATAEAAGIPLNCGETPSDVLVQCDRGQVVSAITNLLDNAVKYSEVGRPVEIGAEAGDGRVTVSVRDQGIGIPSRDLERIFERFYRVDRARSRATGGTGLGLSIVRHVAQAHGGDVTVESREGEGSTFRLRLPAAPGAARPHPTATEVQEARDG
jgi:two-component system sensor histidine kinase SenX3